MGAVADDRAFVRLSMQPSEFRVGKFLDELLDGSRIQAEFSRYCLDSQEEQDPVSSLFLFKWSRNKPFNNNSILITSSPSFSWSIISLKVFVPRHPKLLYKGNIMGAYRINKNFTSISLHYTASIADFLFRSLGKLPRANILVGESIFIEKKTVIR